MSDSPQSSLVLYQTEDGQTRIECLFEEGTIWLPQLLIAELYQVTVPTVNERLKGIYEDRELDTGATIRKFRIVQTEGNRQVGRLVEHYGLEAIFSTPENRVFKNFRGEPIEGQDFSTMD